MMMVGRPVNIQATGDLVMFLRGDLLGQPYLTLVAREAERADLTRGPGRPRCCSASSPTTFGAAAPAARTSLAAVIRDAAVDLVVLQEATRPGGGRAPRGDDGIRRVMPPARADRWHSSAACRSRRHRWVRPRFSQHAFLEIVPAGLNSVSSACTSVRCMPRGPSAAGSRARALLAELARDQTGPHRGRLATSTRSRPTSSSTCAKLPRRLRLLVWLSGGRIRWQTIAIMLGAGYSDAYRARGTPANAGATFPTWDPHIRLDYAFVARADTAQRDWRVTSSGRRRGPPRVGSLSVARRVVSRGHEPA